MAGAIGGAVPVGFLGQNSSYGPSGSDPAPEIGGQQGISTISDLLSGLPFIFSGLVIVAVLIFVFWAISIFARIAVIIAADESPETTSERGVGRYLDDGAAYFFRVAGIDIIFGLIALMISLGLVYGDLSQVLALVDRLPSSAIEMFRVIGELTSRFYTFLGGIIVVGGISLVGPALLAAIGLFVGALLWSIRETAIRYAVLRDLGVVRSLGLGLKGLVHASLSRGVATVQILVFTVAYLVALSLMIYGLQALTFIPDFGITVLTGALVILSIGVIESVVGSFWNQHYRFEASILYSDKRDMRNDTDLGEKSRHQ